ncbi:rod shape-determining protein MreD [Croceicoccus marinus]|uniref:Rod shape-determining protein MreD n=1 Tax=Croceicoccus marinus TaxID=450378 RepID=A0A1Z1FAV2_9SPHN|nr:rod shape-determining protein MreD [Croceicoccus marinus]ARU15872.1 rod shape-determining protein MreD [Croceicoccus marinus]
MPLKGDRLPGEDMFQRRLNRAPSPVLATIIPWLSIAILSMAPLSPIIASAPVLPPFSFMLLIAWRLFRPGMLPLWAGAPLGLFDDLFSGQPIGSAVLLWSLTMIALEALDNWQRWRSFWQDWAVASVMIAAYLFFGHVLAVMAGTLWYPSLLLPQLLISILSFPLFTRLVAILDVLRRARVKVLG